VFAHLAVRGRPVLAYLFQPRGDYARRHARLALVMAPPPRLHAVALSPVERKRIGGENAALLREVLEGVARKEAAPDVAAADAVRARHDHQVGVRADGVERIELDAAQAIEHGG